MIERASEQLVARGIPSVLAGLLILASLFPRPPKISLEEMFAIYNSGTHFFSTRVCRYSSDHSALHIDAIAGKMDYLSRKTWANK